MLPLQSPMSGRMRSQTAVAFGAKRIAGSIKGFGLARLQSPVNQGGTARALFRPWIHRLQGRRARTKEGFFVGRLFADVVLGQIFGRRRVSHRKRKREVTWR